MKEEFHQLHMQPMSKIHIHGTDPKNILKASRTKLCCRSPLSPRVAHEQWRGRGRRRGSGGGMHTQDRYKLHSQVFENGNGFGITAHRRHVGTLG